MRSRRSGRPRDRRTCRTSHLCALLAAVGAASRRLPSTWVNRPAVVGFWRQFIPAEAPHGHSISPAGHAVTSRQASRPEQASDSPAVSVAVDEEESAPGEGSSAGSTATVASTGVAVVAGAQPDEVEDGAQPDEVEDDKPEATADPEATAALFKQLQEDFDALLAVIREAQNSGLNPIPMMQEQDLLNDTIHHALALRALRTEEQFDTALELWEAMENEDSLFKMDIHSYTEVLGVLVAKERWSAIMDTVGNMRRQEIRLNLASYNCLLRAYSEGWQRTKALMVLQEMSKKDVRPDVTSYELALRSCYGFESASETVMALLKSMQASDIMLSETCYRRAIRVLGRDSKWKQSIQLFDMMRSNSIKPDEITVIAFLQSCSKAPDAANIALRKLQKVESDEDVDLSEHNYDQVINACEQAGNWQEVVSVAARMGARGVTPSPVTSSSVLTACVELGRWELARTLLTTMREEGMDPELEEFGLSEVMRACINAEQWDEALKMHTELRTLRRQHHPEGPDFVDVRNFPPSLAGDAVRLALAEVLDNLSNVSRGSATQARTFEGMGVLVDNSAIIRGRNAIPRGRRTQAVEGSTAAHVMEEARRLLGDQANLLCQKTPYACVWITKAALESTLLQQRVQKAMADFKPDGSTGETGDAPTATSRSL